MAVAVSQLKLDAIDECDADEFDIDPAMIDRWWDVIYATGRTGFLTQLYLKQRILMYMLGKLRKNINVSQNQQRVDAQGLFRNVLDMLRYVNADISRLDPFPVEAIGLLNSVQPTRGEYDLTLIEGRVLDLDFA